MLETLLLRKMSLVFILFEGSVFTSYCMFYWWPVSVVCHHLYLFDGGCHIVVV